MSDSLDIVQDGISEYRAEAYSPTMRRMHNGLSTTRRVVSASVIAGLQAGLDILAMVLAIVVADHYHHAAHGSAATLWVLFFAGSMLLALWQFGFYRIGRLTRWSGSALRFLVVAPVSVAVMSAVFVWMPASQAVDPLWLSMVVAVSLTSMWLGRFLLTWGVRAGLRRGLLGESVAVVGTGAVARKFIEQLLSHPEDQWCYLVGVFDDRSEHRLAALPGVSLLGGIDDIERHVRDGRVQHIVIALPLDAAISVDDLRRKLASLPASLSLTWDPVRGHAGSSAMSNGGNLSLLQEMPLLKLKELPTFGWAAIAKWFEDRLLALFAVILLAPVFVVIALLIKLDSPGPVLFRQRRYGFNKRPIMVYKFRTMHHDSAGNQRFRQATKHDKRVTRLGRLLRKTSLDELPQLFNVLEGKMSLVGPRPHPVQLDDHFKRLIEGLDERHCVKPGITGWAQINGFRGETDTLDKMEARIAYDIAYIENWSLWLDIKILLRTAVGGWVDDNAY